MTEVQRDRDAQDEQASNTQDAQGRAVVDPIVPRGFQTTWEVCSAYTIQEDRLYPMGDARETYAPMRYMELPSEIAKLPSGDTKAVLDFAKTYGLMGYAALHPKTPADGQTQAGGEPLTWIWAHAQGLKLCFDLSMYLYTQDEAKLDAYLEAYRAGKAVRGLQPYAAVIASRDQVVHQRWLRQADSSAVKLARDIRRQLINQNIVGIHRAFQDVDGRDQAHFVCSALVEAAYWHLGETVLEQRHPVLRCEGCGAAFVQRDPRQRFCPPRLHQKSSACAIRVRVRKHRQIHILHVRDHRLGKPPQS